MKLSWDVDGVQITANRLEDGIEAGMERAVERILEVLERDAKNTIRVNKRVFTTEVVNSFTDQTGTANIEDGISSRFLNTAKHAGAVEHGVHPSKYADGGPPIAALMPWVLVNLQDWQLNDGGDEPTGGNTLKQSLSEEVTQSVSEKVNWTNITYKGFDRLHDDERENLESSIKASDLDDLVTTEMYNEVRSWKSDSNPERGDTERIVQYATNVKETFGIDATPRGEDLYTAEPTYSETKEAYRTLHEISKTYAYNHLDDGGGSFTAYRYPQRTEISNLGKQIWENPLDDEWTLDVNVINNYSTERREIDMFDKGVLHNADVDIEDDLLFVPDHIVKARNDHEAEIHFRGDSNFGFHRDDLDLTGPGSTRVTADRVLNNDFDMANFAELSDEQMLSLSGLVKHMGEKGVTVETQQARDRLNAWLDEFLLPERDLWTQTDTADYKWEQYVDKITS